MENIVEFKNVSKYFKGFSLKNNDLAIKKGAITGFIGANGAGKSTTIKLMMHLLKADEGAIELFGLNYERNEKEIKERIGFVYDENVFYENLDLETLHTIIAPAYVSWDERQFEYYIEQFDLPMDKTLKTFSKGMQMKVSLAIALSHDAEFIIMDEPTAGLDPTFRREMLNILRNLMVEEQRTIFFSTHITSDLDKIADHIAFIHDGKILFNQSMNSLLNQYLLVKGKQEVLIENPDLRQLFIHFEQTTTEFQGLTDQIDEVNARFARKVELESATLEDIMYFMIGVKREDA
ncbi:ABC transporter ATP-binding protein [Tetragenococcus koreensis]|uniref:ABC transporter ATP-binding protein n=1 Tax=Tetragenococcus koreensis TaxID=290335 RepID=UPI000F4D9FEF|nr:ABC transporter ATP-binding protein [Tetragenococcus koreensis]AYW45539.1 sodium ABC transporter ATP-binding protein [Tetragenococcus koreensis]MCF1618192.1 ABC transporter ATP-binding protein [Tetragenococcus koreensis]MCF1623047.1 ABC transporter ATP-binding protein [Tetragenococcus koreensis]MCF1679018.1 ABC transporter ATP-binding protein [Tetragenococcus koreensis]MCF1681450.1 ABC transporter ATP-binding protein [Tetragenococcus koreensis]